MSGSPVDPDGLLEYSVVFTDRSLNHMSKKFQGVMNEVSSAMKRVYKAPTCILVPGGGSYAMESVARQFGTGKKCLVVRNGWFSYRWTQIFEACNLPMSSTVLKARRVGEGPTAPFAPPPIEDVVAAINAEKPDVVFAPHVETSAGIILPMAYIKAIADAVHANGGIFVLDGVASGCIWIDMVACGVDVYISAPQKGWSATPCAGIVMLNELATTALASTTSTSFCMDLKKWHSIMQAYENGGHAYHATLPTDGIVAFAAAIRETEALGLDVAAAGQQALGDSARALLESKGYVSVAAEGYKAPGVIVSFTSDPDIKCGKKFVQNGMQIAAGVPLALDEGGDFSTFRIGLFGLNKIKAVEQTVNALKDVLEKF
jgi:aspartate aminotransferase-like enzyme